MTFADFRALLEERRSVRYFSDKPLERKLLEQLLETGMLAPSVENTQPWHFHVILNPELKAKMMECLCYGNFVAGSAAFIVATCDKMAERGAAQTIWNPRELEYSCIAAMHCVMLASVTHNLGSCWVSLHHGPAHNLLKLPDHHVIVGGLMLGYLKPGEEQPSGHHERKALATAVTYYE